LDHIKYIVDCGEPFWKPNAISQWPTYFNDFIRSNIAWS
jgi:hypothetical protein